MGQELSLPGDFPPVTREQWRAAAEQSLGGRSVEDLVTHTLDGLTLRPLYTREDLPGPTGYPRLPPFARGSSPLGSSVSGWEVCLELVTPDPHAAAESARAARERGAGSVWLACDRLARLGLEANDARGSGLAPDGLVVATAADLAPLAEAVVPAGVPVHLRPGGSALALAAAWAAAAAHHGASGEKLTGSLGCDPLASLATDGEVPCSLDVALDQMAELARWAQQAAPGLRSATVSTLPYHLAGATAVQELAIALATLAEYLRAMTAGGLEVDAAAAQLRLVVPVGRDLIAEVAKLRALRALAADVVRACGGSAARQALPVHAVTSPRTLTVRDPWVNLLRTTVEGFAAVVGGADVLTVLPFDAAGRAPGELGERLALNLHAILREEAQLHRVVDPGGGSAAVEALTDQLGRAAWALFAEIERRGGMRACLLDGWVTVLVAEAALLRGQAFSSGREQVLGVSCFEPPDEAEPGQPAVAAPRARTASQRRSDPQVEAVLAALVAAGRGKVMDAAVAAFASGASLAQVSHALARGMPRATMPPLSRLTDEAACAGRSGG